MKIHLKNIKCYHDKLFDFGSKGLSLLIGQSGKGKSSIIQGIYFALFGSGNKITSVGKKSCSVELEFDGMKVFRSKNPGRLLVNDIVEGDAAQQLINEKFGSTFEVTGYIPQNAVKSFVLMNPQDKLAFLERFAFTETDLSDIKTKCKNEISIKHLELTEASARLELAKEMVDENEEPEFVEFPIKVKNENYQKAIKNEKIRYKNSTTLIKKHICEIEIEKAKLTHYQQLNSTILEKSTIMDSLTPVIEKMEYEITTLKSHTDQALRDVCLQELDSIVNNREYLSLKKSYEENKRTVEKMVSDETEKMGLQIRELTSTLWSLYSEEEAIEMANDYELTMNDLSSIEKLKKRVTCGDKTIDELQVELKGKIDLKNNIELTKNVHSCPSCKTSLRFVNGTLSSEGCIEKVSSNVSIDQLTDQINVLSKQVHVLSEISKITDSYEELPDISIIKEDYEYIKEYIFENKKNNAAVVDISRALKNKIYSASCMSYIDKVEKQKREFESLIEPGELSFRSSRSEEDLRVVVDSQNENISNLKYLQKSLGDVRLQVEECNKYICSVFKDGEVSSKDDLIARISASSEEIKNKTAELSDLMNKKEKHGLNLLQIEKWENMMENMKKYNAMEDRVISLQNKETLKRDEYSALLSLKDHILEAESIAMVNIVDSINTHARVYLDDFFEDDPISVSLTVFKKTKKLTKAQISMDIEYKGMECDLQMLSGGEMSRIVLAYTLALAEMFNTPLLLLDECTSSLDQETTNHVFDSINEHFNGKLTIIVAHQVVTGIFDKTISLDN